MTPRVEMSVGLSPRLGVEGWGLCVEERGLSQGEGQRGTWRESVRMWRGEAGDRGTKTGCMGGEGPLQMQTLGQDRKQTLPFFAFPSFQIESLDM